MKDKIKFDVEISSIVEKEGFQIDDMDSSGICGWIKIENYYGDNIDDVINQVNTKYNITKMEEQELEIYWTVYESEDYFIEIYTDEIENLTNDNIDYLNEQMRLSIEKEDYETSAQIKLKIEKLKIKN